MITLLENSLGSLSAIFDGRPELLLLFVVGGTLLACVVPLLMLRKPTIGTGEAKEGYEEYPPDLVILHQFDRPRTLNVPGFSPSCLKLETYLRMTGTPYVIKTALPGKGPKKKLPFIIVDGKTIPDSQLCLWYLRDHGIVQFDIDAHLNAEERAVAEAMRYMAEERLGWVSAYERWGINANFPAVIQHMLSAIPVPLRHILAYIARRGSRQALWSQGVGRYTHEELKQFAFEVLDSLSEFLGDKPYMMGDRPSSLDCSVFANIIAWSPRWGLNNSRNFSEMIVGSYLLEKDNLVDYIERITTEFYPEFCNETVVSDEEEEE
ncbi:hypothetical protein BJ742DRAFT_787190 [Cladochytrium replicatum]|nr:hypothetical protein BJ742DRAFT_787190 [Cladochytrium replicatum]